MTGQHDDFGFRSQFFNFGKGGDAVHNRHFDIEHDHVKRFFGLYRLQSLESIQGGGHLKASEFQQLGQIEHELFFIVHDQDADVVTHSGCSFRFMTIALRRWPVKKPNDTGHRPAQQNKPDGNDDTGGYKAFRPIRVESFLGLRPVFGQYCRRNHLQRQADAERQQDEIIQISQHRNEIRDQIYRAQGICDDTSSKRFGIP